jgi:hypothetical protein
MQFILSLTLYIKSNIIKGRSIIKIELGVAELPSGLGHLTRITYHNNIKSQGLLSYMS